MIIYVTISQLVLISSTTVFLSERRWRCRAENSLDKPPGLRGSPSALHLYPERTAGDRSVPPADPANWSSGPPLLLRGLGAEREEHRSPTYRCFPLRGRRRQPGPEWHTGFCTRLRRRTSACLGCTARSGFPSPPASHWSSAPPTAFARPQVRLWAGTLSRHWRPQRRRPRNASPSSCEHKEPVRTVYFRGDTEEETDILTKIIVQFLLNSSNEQNHFLTSSSKHLMTDLTHQTNHWMLLTLCFPDFESQKAKTELARWSLAMWGYKKDNERYKQSRYTKDADVYSAGLFSFRHVCICLSILCVSVSD